MKVSIIIRAKDEERWVTSCLNAVFRQDHKDIEVIFIDNQSKDMTVAKAEQFDVKVLHTDEYLPGKAINMGIEASTGDYIAILSAHCIPKNSMWLSNLLKNFEDDSVAGVYGRQEPMSFTNDLDKRDLYIVFGFDRRVQVKDSFFHNANSLIRRSVWEKIPFDSTVKNIEDRVWGQQVIDQGYKLVYEPEASVYHHHGIHQSMDAERCKSIVRIMESLNLHNGGNGEIDDILSGLNIVGIVTVKGQMEYFVGEPLIKHTIDTAKESKLMNSLVVSTDDDKMLNYCSDQGVDINIKRPTDLSQDHIGIEKVLEYSLKELETKMGIFPDMVVYLGVQSPFRPKGLVDDLIKLLVKTGFDSVLPGYPTYKSCWTNGGESIRRVDEGFLPRSRKHPIHIGYPGLACVTMPQFIREGRLLGDKVEILEILDIYSTIEIKDSASLKLAEKIFPNWKETL
ncbi:MAG: glycosyltransferase family 2 protein [Pseudomonadota bacterium]